MITLKQPANKNDFKDYYHFRWRLLRAPWGEKEGTETDEIENDCFHIMAVNNDQQIVAVGRLQFNSKDEAQIRYMAVDTKYERQGIGQLIVKTLEQHARKHSIKMITLDARELAVGFYKRLGYRVKNKSYLLFGEIQHFKMIKSL